MLLSRVSRLLVPRARSISSQPLAVQQEVEVNDDSDEPVWDMSNPYDKERRECLLCKHKIVVDYKNVQLISQFVSPHTGKLYDRHITGLCLKQQERLALEHKKAMSFLLMPACFKDLRFVRDPKLFDPFHPQRPNPH